MRRTTNRMLSLVLFGSLLWTSMPAIASAATISPPASVRRQETSQPVYALQGTLGKAENQNFSTFLLTPDGTAYALVGQDPQVEQQLTTLRDQRATVKVWGTLYPQGRVSATPEIVVANVLPVEAAPAIPTPTPPPAAPTPPPATSAVPTAIVRNAGVNIRSGPGTNYETVGTVGQGVVCTIVGRDATNLWWQVQCANGLNGWLYQPLADTTGNTSGVPVTAAPPPPPPPAPPPQPTTFYGWKAEYFPNPDLTGAPANVQDVSDVNFNWGGGGPPGVPTDNFSTRFTRTINFNSATYRFRVRSDDGVRVYIDGQIIIDQWNVHSANIEYTADRTMYGNQTVVIEHFEATGNAELYFSFAPISNQQTVDGGGSGDWQASYFNNTDLSGNPALTRHEPRSNYPLDVDWGTGSPASGIINDDNFSARWVGSFYFDYGDYVFESRTDDGVRVYIDGIRILDAWSDGYKTPSNKFLKLGSGNHQITIEYYERGGTAFNRVWWWRDEGGNSGDSSGGGIPRDD